MYLVDGDNIDDWQGHEAEGEVAFDGVLHVGESEGTRAIAIPCKRRDRVVRGHQLRQRYGLYSNVIIYSFSIPLEQRVKGVMVFGKEEKEGRKHTPLLSIAWYEISKSVNTLLSWRAARMGPMWPRN